MTINLCSVSGGKDSTAVALLAIEQETPNLRFLFCDTGIEADETYAYLEYLDGVLRDRAGVGIMTVKADFKDRIDVKREKLIAEGAPSVRTEALHATGNPFLDLCILKGRFPSSKARFCTQELKIFPIEKLTSELAKNDNVVQWIGVRRDESFARRNTMCREREREIDGHFIDKHHPIRDWTERMCFDFLEKHGVKRNPLYDMGYKRVGCFPCMQCRKSELQRISIYQPERIDMIREWEQIVSRASKRGGATFFHEFHEWGIDGKVAWSNGAFPGQISLELEM